MYTSRCSTQRDYNIAIEINPLYIGGEQLKFKKRTNSMDINA